MGAVTGMLGLNGGVSGTGVSGPTSTNFLQPVSSQQLSNADATTQNSMQSQQALLQALQGQNGLGNQNQVYSQMQGIANGTGPNPAQQQYQNNAQQIAAQQSGAIASAKGISPALQARLIAQQGGQAMQNAAGQGAANLATQQLNAMGMAGNMANQMAGQQIGQVNTNTQTAQNQQNMLLGGMQGFNNNLGGMQANINSNNTGLAQGIMGNQAAAIGGLANGAGAAIGKPPAKAGGAHGGIVANGAIVPPSYAVGGMVPGGPCSGFGKHISMKSGGAVPGSASVSGDSPKNDTVDAKLSPGEVVLPRSVVNSKNAPKAAAEFLAAVLAKKGKK